MKVARYGYTKVRVDLGETSFAMSYEVAKQLVQDIQEVLCQIEND